MTLVLDILHFIAAALLAVIGFGYEREEECEPVHYGQVAVSYEHQDATEAQLLVASHAEMVETSDCEQSSAPVTYPVL